MSTWRIRECGHGGFVAEKGVEIKSGIEQVISLVHICPHLSFQNQRILKQENKQRTILQGKRAFPPFPVRRAADSRSAEGIGLKALKALATALYPSTRHRKPGNCQPRHPLPEKAALKRLCDNIQHTAGNRPISRGTGRGRRGGLWYAKIKKYGGAPHAKSQTAAEKYI